MIFIEHPCSFDIPNHTGEVLLQSGRISKLTSLLQQRQIDKQHAEELSAHARS